MLDAAHLLELQRLVRRIPAPPTIIRHAVDLARATRPRSQDASPLAKKYISWGAGPRASQNLVLGAKAMAAMDGRSVPDLEDVDAMVVPVMSHRVVLNFQAEAEGVPASTIVSPQARR